MQTTPKMSLEKTFALTPVPSPRSAGHYRRVVLLDTRAVLSAREDRCVGVPKGQSRIAQRFNAGLGAERSRVPKGRLRSNPTPDPSAFSRPFGTCEPCGMFPGVKTPGYSQDVPPGQRNLVAAFSGKKATRFTNDAFKSISRLRCPATKMWDTITPTVSSEKNVGRVQPQERGKRAQFPGIFRPFGVALLHGDSRRLLLH